MRPEWEGDDRGAAAEGGPSLDLSTQLGDPSVEREQDSGWRFTIWPECAEASLVWLTAGSGSGHTGRRRSSEGRNASELVGTGARRSALRMTRDGVAYFDESWTSFDPSVSLDLLRAQGDAQKWKQANGRAATRSRRYFVRNALRYMWVLTFAVGEYDRRRAMQEVSEFARRLRSVLGGVAFAYWYSPEVHPGGHGWHVNFFIAQRQPHALIAQVWGLGFAWATDFATSARAPKGEPLGLCANPREGCRRAARYGCKYAQKDWSAEHIGPSNHRYEVAQGFAPVKHSQWVSGRPEADRLVAAMVPADGWGGMSVWDSDDSEDWVRPPVRTWRW